MSSRSSSCSQRRLCRTTPPCISRFRCEGVETRYRFKFSRPNDSLGLPIGQHISIVAQIGDKEIQRSYTPISSDDDRGYFDLMIKVAPRRQWLIEELSNGQHFPSD